MLLLDQDVIANLERMKEFCSTREFILHGELSVAVGLGSVTDPRLDTAIYVFVVLVTQQGLEEVKLKA